MFGGLLVGPIVYKFASEARDHGVPEVMSAVALHGETIRPLFSHHRVANPATVSNRLIV